MLRGSVFICYLKIVLTKNFILFFTKFEIYRLIWVLSVYKLKYKHFYIISLFILGLHVFCERARRCDYAEITWRKWDEGQQSEEWRHRSRGTSAECASGLSRERLQYLISEGIRLPDFSRYHLSFVLRTVGVIDWFFLKLWLTCLILIVLQLSVHFL